MTKKIVFIEGNEDIENLKNIIFSSDVKIISFDFKGHKKLASLGINHSLVEEYFSKEDEEKLDNKAVELTREWYKHPDIANLLIYNGINLGSLLEIEIIGYFFDYLKRVLGIVRIIEKETPEEIFTSFLSSQTKTVCKNSEIKIHQKKTTQRTLLFFDSVEIPIQVRGKMRSVKISRKKFILIKKLITKILDSIFKIKPKYNEIKNNKSILLSDYNPVQYETLFEELSNSKINILLLNQRRPAIWNYKSLQIIKKSKCKIIELNDFSSKKLLSKIKTDQNNIKIKLKKLWEKKETMNEIFLIEGHSYWDAIKENFIPLVTRRFVEAVERFQLLEELFNKISTSCILEWAHVGMEDKLLISIANRRKIPNMFLQHGLYNQSTKSEKYIPIQPFMPTDESKHIVWGEILNNYLINHGAKQENIIPIGSPRHDKFFRDQETKDESKNVLFAANGTFYINCSGSDTRVFQRMETLTRKVFETIKKNSSKKIIVKLHPGKVSYDIKPLLKEIDPAIEIYQNENVMDLLKKCDCMIALNYSTVLLDALIAQKPVLMLIGESEQCYEEEILLKNNAVLFTSDIDKIEDMINSILYDEKIRNKLIKKGNEFVNEYILNRGDASKKIVELLEKNGIKND